MSGDEQGQPAGNVSMSQSSGQLTGADGGRLTPPSVAPDSEPLHEWQCPACGATTRARMVDAPADSGQIRDEIADSIPDWCGLVPEEQARLADELLSGPVGRLIAELRTRLQYMEADLEHVVIERDQYAAQVQAVQEFVDGFAARGGRGPITDIDQLWILAIRRRLDGGT